MKELAQKARDKCAQMGAEFADVRAVRSVGSNVLLQDGRADKVNTSSGSGLGVRVLVDGAWGFASMTAARQDEMDECIEAAFAMAKASRQRLGEMSALAEAEAVEDKVTAEYEKDPSSVPIGEKMNILRGYEQAAIGKHKGKLVNTSVSYSETTERMVLCNTRGTLIDSESMRVMVGANVTAQEGEVRQRGHEHKGKQCGFELIEGLTAEELSVKAADRAVALLSARRAPAGKFPVVFAPSIAGLFVHEALGHNAEADLVLAGESILEGKLGEKIAADCVNVVDDGTIPQSWGSYKYDSEGVPAQRRQIIKDGVLVGFMQSLQTAAKLGAAPNGSARAQSYQHRPVVRMSNTFIVPGQQSFEELIKDIAEGIYMSGGHWGYVMCEKGQYTCHAGEGWMIRNGELAEHIRDVSISGMVLDTLMNVEGVSDAFEMEMPGNCGKSGQSMPVNGGGPHVRVQEVVVGGQE
ncbi:MAG: TldD/PmbA family protein [Armatimonadota bacterium]